ncbi:MAG: VOC family protein [Treponema sp.]|nr:VOC family protein [Treponema sp.]
MIEQCLTGLQHIGIPTNDIKATIDFYKALGFEIVKEEYLEK